MMFFTPAQNGRVGRPSGSYAGSKVHIHHRVFIDHGMNGAHAGVVDQLFERTGRRGENDGERDGAAVDMHVLDHVERDEVLAQIGLLHVAQRLEDIFSGNCHRSAGEYESPWQR